MFFVSVLVCFQSPNDESVDPSIEYDPLTFILKSLIMWLYHQKARLKQLFE